MPKWTPITRLSTAQVKAIIKRVLARHPEAKGLTPEISSEITQEFGGARLPVVESGLLRRVLEGGGGLTRLERYPLETARAKFLERPTMYKPLLPTPKPTTPPIVISTTGPRREAITAYESVERPVFPAKLDKIILQKIEAGIPEKTAARLAVEGYQAWNIVRNQSFLGSVWRKVVGGKNAQERFISSYVDSKTLPGFRQWKPKEASVIDTIEQYLGTEAKIPEETTPLDLAKSLGRFRR